MARRRPGTVVYREDLAPNLLILRLMPETGTKFPTSKAGQYIALSCDECGLTTETGVGSDGKPIYGPDLDETGTQRTGQVTHSYSIASAPWEQEEQGYLEFYLALETLRGGGFGRLSSVFAQLDPDREQHRTLHYFDRIAGTFTLEDRTADVENVLMIGSGTGLAPFVAMTKQLHHDARTGRSDGRRYTLVHTNRTRRELGYHEALQDLERAASFDFVYVPTVSRPTVHDRSDPHLGAGRANNVLRHLFGLPTKEHETGEQERSETAARPVVEPVLPARIHLNDLSARVHPSRTKILACGNPAGVADMRQTAERVGIAFDQEAW